MSHRSQIAERGVSILNSSDSTLPELVTAVPGPRSLAIASKLNSLESPDATFYSPEFPIAWESARGCNVWDVDGNRYLDLNAAFGVAAMGHSHPNVVEAIRAQSEHLIHGMGDVHPTEIRPQLAEELISLAPGDGDWKVIWGTSGSDAVEAAMKTAMIATGRSGFVAFRGGYHGLSLGAMQATGWNKFHEGVEAWRSDRVTVLPYPGARYAERDTREVSTKTVPASSEHVLSALNHLFEASSDRSNAIAAVLIEPIQGRGGIIEPPPGFMRDLRTLCADHGALLIADEIYTGLGRTGSWFACEHENALPDLLLVGKSLGGGMPISACLGRTDAIDAWGESRGESRHTQTFAGHPLGCAAALATLRTMRELDAPRLAERTGSRFKARLIAELGDRPSVREVRGRGMMIGIEFQRHGQPSPEIARSMMIGVLRRGLIVLTAGMKGNVLSLTPPFTLEDRQMDFAARALGDTLTEIESACEKT